MKSGKQKRFLFLILILVLIPVFSAFPVDSNSTGIHNLSIWDNHTWQIIAVFLLCLSEALLIGYLLVQKKKNRLSEQKLSKTRKFRDDLIKTANALILGLDTRGNVTLLNPAAEKITGYLKSEIEGKNWFEMLIPGGKHQEILDELNHLSDEGVPRWYENKILTKNGRERIISWSHSEIRQDGKTEGTILIGIDVTERKQAEGLLKESEEKYREIMESTPDIRYRKG